MEVNALFNNVIYSEIINGKTYSFADVDKVEGISREQLRSLLADIIEKDNLDYVNKHGVPVHVRHSFYTNHGKRIIDVLISGTALIMLTPINSVLALCTLLDVGRPIIFTQYRTGKDGKQFSIIKFRNMTNETDEKGELLPASKRVTKFGRFVRKTSLDELLNFWSIFKGDMSIIGPRPLPTGYYKRFSDRHKYRHAVRPGLECPLLGESSARPSWSAQFDNDVFYVENVSLGLDIKMCLALVKMVFDRKTAEKRGNSNRGTFLGYTKEGNSINTHRVPTSYLYELDPLKLDAIRI